MSADFRALCVELTDCLEKADWPLRHRYVFRQWIDIARAALADGPAVPEGREPAAVTGQPSDGEVAELVAWLRETGDTIHPSHLAEHQRYKRAAEPLQRQALVPVPVSERPWEREGWCDKHGQCWAFNKDLPAWEFLDHANSCKWADLFLPAHALPLPEVGA